jgi:hypothetical protein
MTFEKCLVCVGVVGIVLGLTTLVVSLRFYHCALLPYAMGEFFVGVSVLASGLYYRYK